MDYREEAKRFLRWVRATGHPLVSAGSNGSPPRLWSGSDPVTPEMLVRWAGHWAASGAASTSGADLLRVALHATFLTVDRECIG